MSVILVYPDRNICLGKDFFLRYAVSFQSESIFLLTNATSFFHPSYAYDKNGNLSKDLNKKITNISYNSLHLPKQLTINGVVHKYTYAADGRKLKVMQGGIARDYAGSIIYENGSLKRILIEGGYIEGGTYYFYFNDHLGNVCAVVSASGNTVQCNHYYPFGLPMAETRTRLKTRSRISTTARSLNARMA